MVQKVLVTGGGGFLGRAIVQKSLAKGDEVVSFARNHYPQLATMGVAQIKGDLQDAAAVENACQGVDVVFHTAAKAGVWGPWHAYYGPNVVGTGHVIAGCRKHNIKRLIYTSSPSVVFDGCDQEGVDESTPYAEEYHAHYPATKAIAEKMVRKAAVSGLPTITLRPHLVWGPRDTHLTPRILVRAHRLRRIGTGANRVDTIYIDNAAQAHLLAEEQLAKNPHLAGRVYFISQDDPIPVWEMVNAILAAAGKPPVNGRISTKRALIVGALFETLYRKLGITKEPPLTRFVALELATAHWFDISAAKKDLGYRPLISTAEGLEKLSLWLKSTDQSLSQTNI